MNKKTQDSKFKMICCLLSTVCFFFNGCAVTDNNTYHSVTGFPQSMVGIWKSELNAKATNRWGLKFEEDGAILRILHNFGGYINVEEGGVRQPGPTEDTFLDVILGDVKQEYDPRSKHLKVTIITDYYRMLLPTGELTGRIEDYIEGRVSKDGKTWVAEWRNYNFLDNADPPPIDIIKENPVKLIFHKYDIETLESP